MARIYLSGPMSGIKDLNFAKFDRVKAKLIRMGFEVVSPADLDRKRGQLSYHDTLKDDIKHLLTCDAIYLMRGWQKSNGARLEYVIARGIGLKVFFE